MTTLRQNGRHRESTWCPVYTSAIPGNPDIYYGDKYTFQKSIAKLSNIIQYDDNFYPLKYKRKSNQREKKKPIIQSYQ